MTKKALGNELGKFWWTNIRRSFVRNLFEKIRGHSKTSLAPGIQQPLHATDYVWCLKPNNEWIASNATTVKLRYIEFLYFRRPVTSNTTRPVEVYVPATINANDANTVLFYRTCILSCAFVYIISTALFRPYRTMGFHWSWRATWRLDARTIDFSNVVADWENINKQVFCFLNCLQPGE